MSTKNLKYIIPIAFFGTILIGVLAAILLTTNYSVKLKTEEVPPVEDVDVYVLEDSSVILASQLETTLVINNQADLKRLRTRIEYVIGDKNIDNVIVTAFPTASDSLFAGFLQTYTIKNVYLPKSTPNNFTSKTRNLNNVSNVQCIKKGSVFILSAVKFTVLYSGKDMGLYGALSTTMQGVEERIVIADKKVTIPEGGPVMFTVMNGDQFTSSGFRSCQTFYYGGVYDGSIMQTNGGRAVDVKNLSKPLYGKFNRIAADFTLTDFNKSEEK